MADSLLRRTGAVLLSLGLAGIVLPPPLSTSHIVLAAVILAGLWALWQVAKGFNAAVKLGAVQREQRAAAEDAGPSTEPGAEEPVATPSHLWDRRN